MKKRYCISLNYWAWNQTFFFPLPQDLKKSRNPQARMLLKYQETTVKPIKWMK